MVRQRAAGLGEGKIKKAMPRRVLELTPSATSQVGSCDART